LNEEPLLIMPKLAEIIGLNESIVLQQMHYWIKKNKERKINYHKGKYWTYNSYEGWRSNFPFWSARTIRRIINSLEKQKLLTSDNFNKLKYDKTKWYTINYKMLEKVAKTHADNMDRRCGQDGHLDVDNMTQPIPETNQRKTTETISLHDKVAYIYFEDLKDDDVVKETNNIISPSRSKIKESNYDKAFNKISYILVSLGFDNYNECIGRYLIDKPDGRSIENFIEHLNRYEKEL
jgi:hypothetical protein